MAARMLPAIMSLEKRIAMSDQGKVAVLKKPENCIDIWERRNGKPRATMDV